MGFIDVFLLGISVAMLTVLLVEADGFADRLFVWTTMQLQLRLFVCLVAFTRIPRGRNLRYNIAPRMGLAAEAIGFYNLDKYTNY